MEAVFWGLIGLVGFIYFGYPAVLCLLNFSRGGGNRFSQVCPRVSLIIPAHNEEKVIEKKIRNACALDYPRQNLEVIVALDGCTDNTAKIVSKYLSDGIKMLNCKPRRGKAAMLNKAVEQAANGEIIVFTDANTIFRKDAIKKLMRRFSDSKIGCVCGDLRYFSNGDSSVGKGENLYWKYERALKMKESGLGEVLVTNGSIYAIRKELFQPIDLDIADDFVIPMRVAKLGYKVEFEPEAIALEKVTRDLKEEFKQKTRIITQGLKASVRYWKLIFSCGFLRGLSFLLHKFLRWLVPLFLIIIFMVNLLIVRSEAPNKYMYKLFLVGQVIFYLSALLGLLWIRKGRKIRGVFYIPFYFCLVNLASLVGLYKFLTASRTEVWDKAETTR